MATSFNVSGLTAYTQGNPQKALEVMILTGKGTKDIFSVETGVKYRDKITDITNVDVDISTGKISGYNTCLLYTSDAADDLLCVDLGGRRIIKKKTKKKKKKTLYKHEKH